MNDTDTQDPAITPAGVGSGGPWEIVEESWEPGRANYFETIFTVGNGRLGTRGSLEEGHLGSVSGTYLAGVYDAHDSQVIDLVNAPDWLATEIFVDDERLDTETASVTEHRRVLDLRTGVLARTTVFTRGDGSRVKVQSRRFASMHDRDACHLALSVTLLDKAGTVTVATSVDAHRRNMECLPVYPEGTVFTHERKWEKWALSQHLHEQGHGFAEDIGWVVTRTIDSGIDVAYAMRVAPVGRTEPQTRRRGRHESVTTELAFTAAVGETVGIEKTVAVATSRDVDSGDAGALLRARRTVLAAPGFDEALADSSEAWADMWRAADCRVIGDDRAALAMRFAIYHLLIAANPDDPTVNIGAKSLSGEGYRGHVFWDTEVMMLPFYLFTQPGTARALLGYRFHTLDGARAVAANDGNAGARYPWESADTGREECPIVTPDGQNRFYTRDQELHVTANVAYAIGRYREVTGDTRHLLDEGAEIVFDTARFWLDRCEDDGGRLVLKTVMGPDEFHSFVDNNAYTNRMVRWHWDFAVSVFDELTRDEPARLAEICADLGVGVSDRDAWAEAAERIVAPRDPDCGLIEQFDGYFAREEVPVTEWDDNDMPRYPAGFNHFNCETTTLLKQPDVVQLMFQLPDDYTESTRRENFEFYEKRTLHKSSLSPSIHAIVGLRVGDASMAERYFARSAYVDLDDNQGNTEDGMHIASAGGTWQIAILGFGGFGANDTGLHFAPRLPASWERLRFTIQWRGREVEADLGHDESRFRLLGDGGPETITVDGRAVELEVGRTATIATAAVR
ncbi:glycoside hydrolase family 65 protein [Tsukamurella sp. 1534]|uniref:glycoside hydrolase family 65 protein n=1 Tax=Tsukamurella sp. 1534 TaxID=1151061 RepID=UPI0002DED4B4|nr:glycosyl hydrolase family 65 protein [Tsukamurella sp. 1534]